MKILVVSQYFYPENFKINDLVIGLRELGHEIYVFTGKPNYPQGKFYTGYNLLFPFFDEYCGIKIFRAPLFARGSSKFSLFLNYLSFVIFGSIFIFYFLFKKVDKIFVYEVSPITVALPAIFFSWVKQIPLILWVTDLWPESLTATGIVRNKILLKPINLMVRFIYKNSNKILISSPAFRESILNHSVNTEKIIYFPQWAENYYKKIETENEMRLLNFKKDHLNLMFAGNIGVAQGLGVIVDAVDILKDLKLKIYILGEGRDKNRLLKKISEKKLEHCFEFLGAKSPEMMSHYFYYADALLITLKNEEIFKLTIPAKLQSYLACGKPILGAISGIGAKIIEDSQAGFSVDAEDSLGFSSIIKKFSILNESERKSMGQNALSYYASNFDRDILLHKLQDVLRDSK